jgi:hypothetical protein
MYYRHVKGTTVSDWHLMLTKSDAEFAAAYLNGVDALYIYKPAKRFDGYEGYDGGVNKYEKNEWFRSGKFIERVTDAHLRIICKDRPIVLQEKSWD